MNRVADDVSPSPTGCVFMGAMGNRITADIWLSSAFETERGRDGESSERPPIMLLHGGGQTRHAWSGTAARLAARGHTAITLDQRGHGDSEWVPKGNYAFDSFAEDARAVAETIQERFGSRPIAVGASLGGAACMLAEGHIHPGNFHALVLVDITPRLKRSGVAKILGFMGAQVEQGFGTLEEAADAIAKYLPHRTRPTSLEGLKKNLRLGPDGRYRWHWDPNFIQQRTEYHADTSDAEVRMLSAAANLKLPVFLVRGSQSELVSEEHVQEFRKLVPHASYADVSGAGHMVAGDKNDLFSDALLSFVEDLD
ncbi:MAG: alpha/beta hydrolase [Stappiaceae bacterium]